MQFWNLFLFFYDVLKYPHDVNIYNNNATIDFSHLHSVIETFCTLQNDTQLLKHFES